MDANSVAGKAPPSSRVPHELLTLIFKQLGISDLYSCHAVCKAWRQAGRDDSVLRQLCYTMNYAPRSSKRKQISDLLGPSIIVPQANGRDGHSHSILRLRGRDVADVANWEDVLRSGHSLRQIKFPPPIESVKFGTCSSVQDVLRGYSNQKRLHESDIWRVKIDPIHNLMITTSRHGGLRVLDLEDGQELWCDPTIHAYSDLEYVQGWVVVNCRGEGDGTRFQILKFDRLANTSNDHPRRGVLVPVGSITCPFFPHAFRLRRSHLAAAGCSDVAIFDIAELKLLKHFKTALDASVDWHINYIDLDPDFVFLLAMPLRGPDDDDDDDDEEVVRGLFVYENSEEGRLVYNDSICELVCSSSWELDGHGMGDLRYGQQVLQDCATLGIANSVSAGAKEHLWQYTQTSWCAAVHPDWATRCLVLCGIGTLLVIPNYKRVFRRAQQSAKRTPRIRAIGVSTGCAEQGTTHLAVADGVAAFISSSNRLPTWVDLRSLLQAAQDQPATRPRASTLCLGQSLLESCSGFNFKMTSCLQMNDTKLVVVCDFFKELTGHRPVVPYSIALVMDFGKVLKAKLADPRAPIDQKPSKTTLRFFPHDDLDDLDRRALHIKRNGKAESRIILPDGVQRLWRAWAPKRLPELLPAKGREIKAPHALGPEGQLLDAELWPELLFYHSDDDWQDSDDDESSSTDGESAHGDSGLEEIEEAVGSGAEVEVQGSGSSNGDGQDEAVKEQGKEDGQDGDWPERKEGEAASKMAASTAEEGPQ